LTIDSAPIANPLGPYVADLGESITLNGAASADPDASAGDTIVSYTWNIGDGAIILGGKAPTLTSAAVDALGVGTFPVSLTVIDSFGLSSTAATTLSVYDNRPFVSLSADPNPVAPGDLVMFDAAGSNHGHPNRNIVRYDFNFGDGTTYSETPAMALDGLFDGKTTHVYLTFGAFTASVTVRDDNIPSKTDTTSATIRVNHDNRAPIASSGGAYIANLGSAVTLDGSGSSDPDAAVGDSIVSYAWNLGAGAITVTGSTPSLDPAQLDALGVGTFTVVLTVTDELGATNSAQTTLSIYDNRPFPSLVALPNPSAPAQAVTFDASGSIHGRPDRNIVRYHFNFGDGTTYTETSFSAPDGLFDGKTAHAYALFGAFTTSVIVTDNNLPPKTATASTTINVNHGNRAPVAHFDGPYGIDLGDEIMMDGSTSSDPDLPFGDSIVSYTWDIGTGAITLGGAKPTLSATQVNALGAGTYPVVLTVTDEFGATGSAQTTLSIYDNRPLASLVVNPTPSAPAQSLTFDASASTHGRPDRGIVGYHFNFGDGASYTETSLVAPDGVFDGKTTHAYASFGAFIANVTVSDNGVPPQTGTASTSLTVNQGNRAPVAQIKGPFHVVLGNDVTLDGSGSSEPDVSFGDAIVNYAWNIGNGAITIGGAKPSLISALVNALGAGTYQVNLTVTDKMGASGSALTTLAITSPNRPPIAEAAGAYSTAEGSSLRLNGSGSTDPDEPNTALTFEWDLNYDGLAFDVDANGIQPMVSFPNDVAARTIALRVTDPRGLSDIDTTTLTVSNVAPVLDGSGVPSLNSVERDNDNPDGTLITALLSRGANGDPISDAGADPTGIAIVSADTTNGAWQYSIDNAATWQALGTVSESIARLLAADANTHLRFIPRGAFDGVIEQAIVFRAWDQHQGVNGGVFNIAAAGAGGHTAFSIETETARLFVASSVTTLPGAVDVTVQDGVLTITGDGDANVVTVTGIGTGTGMYEVATPAGAQIVTGVGSIVIALGGGSDTLVMNNIYLRGEVDIQTGAGDDVVTLGNTGVVSCAGELRVDLAAGNDVLDGQRLFIGTNQIINGGDGNDALIFDGFASPQFTLGTSAAGNSSWHGGTGDDRVHVVYGFMVGNWTVDLGDGSDSFDAFGSAASGDVHVFGRGGNDSLRVDTNFFDANLILEGNSDSDSLFLANGLGTEIATLDGGDGPDALTVQNQTAARLQVNTGAGSDAVEVRSSVLDRFFAVLGDDNDQLTARGNLLRLETSLEGGLGGSDRLLALGNRFFGPHRARGFESLV
jgi:hypothetical protein